jgi:hypothetical protein
MIRTRYLHRIVEFASYYKICSRYYYHHDRMCVLETRFFVMLFRKAWVSLLIDLSNCLVEQRARSRLTLSAINVPKKVRRAISNSSRCPCSFVDPSFPFRVNSRLLYSAARSQQCVFSLSRRHCASRLLNAAQFSGPDSIPFHFT